MQQDRVLFCMSHSFSHILRSSCSSWQSTILVPVRCTLCLCVIGEQSNPRVLCVLGHIVYEHQEENLHENQSLRHSMLLTQRQILRHQSPPLDDRKDLTHALVWGSIPARSSLYRSRSWETLSKALLKSITMASHCFLSLRVFKTLSVNSSSCVSQDLSERNPCCLS